MNSVRADDGVGMYAPERQQAILVLARSDGRVDVNGLAETFAVTPETIRRDLTSLERRGTLRRVHGGAIPVERLGMERAVRERQDVASAEKDRIAKAALDQLPEGGSIFIDAGTTTVRLAEMLPEESNLIVLTHALPVASALANHPHLTLHLVGGQVRGRTLAAVGPWAERDLTDVFVDVVFAGTNGISARRGLTTPDVSEAAVKKAQIRAARRVVVLADHTKFGRDEFVQVASLDEVDTVITDSAVDPGMAHEVADAGPEVIRA